MVWINFRCLLYSIGDVETIDRDSIRNITTEGVNWKTGTNCYNIECLGVMLTVTNCDAAVDDVTMDKVN